VTANDLVATRPRPAKTAKTKELSS